MLLPICFRMITLCIPVHEVEGRIEERWLSTSIRLNVLAVRVREYPAKERVYPVELEPYSGQGNFPLDKM